MKFNEMLKKYNLDKKKCLPMLQMESLDRIFADNPNSIALYYYYAVNLDEDSSVPENKITMKSLGWGKEKLSKAKRLLHDINLIEHCIERTRGRITGNKFFLLSDLC